MFSFLYRRHTPAMIACALLAIGCSSQQADNKTARNTALPSDSLVIEYAGADSVTVFDLLCAGHEVDYQATASGVFVKGIDSIPSGDGYFWIYSVNDSIGQVAANRYMTVSTDRIRWHFRRAGN